MVTIEQKLTLFSKLLNQEIKEQTGKEMSALDEEYERLVAESKLEVDKEARELVEAARRRAQAKRVELVSKGKLTNKKERMLMSQKVIERFMKALVEKIAAFEKTASYKAYLEKRVQDAIANETYENELIIRLTEEDLKENKDFLKAVFVKAGLKEEQLKFKLADQEILGGFIIEEPVLNMRIDESIKEMLDEARDRIVELIMTEIDKDGDNVEE